jgi:hypothetical protein
MLFKSWKKKKGKVKNYFHSPKDDKCARENLQRKKERGFIK